ncbi:hypothetical protein B9Z55_016070 [Caenorhabditis nigoni]|uniref:Uncharacterized protein n=1 Tax=Caenorhabditis nigoni TaxID=1611254 RepID=A0A2G5UD36_9PELO|nr:hypothetical protein B9Z55_016070 [Caenorhabditis nigoni]
MNKTKKTKDAYPPAPIHPPTSSSITDEEVANGLKMSDVNKKKQVNKRLCVYSCYCCFFEGHDKLADKLWGQTAGGQTSRGHIHTEPCRWGI